MPWIYHQSLRAGRVAGQPDFAICNWRFIGPFRPAVRRSLGEHLPAPSALLRPARAHARRLRDAGRGQGAARPPDRPGGAATPLALARWCNGTPCAERLNSNPALMKFTRFRQTARRLQASLVETHRHGGTVRHEHVAGLGSVPISPTAANRIAFWTKLHQRLDALSNRLDAAQRAVVLAAIHARIPMPTLDARQTVQLERAKADARFPGAAPGRALAAAAASLRWQTARATFMAEGGRGRGHRRGWRGCGWHGRCTRVFGRSVRSASADGNC